MITATIYWLYQQVFCCKRRIQKLLFQEDLPRKTFWIEIPPPQYPWMYIGAVISDDEEYDVTELVNANITVGELLTPTKLAAISELDTVVRWEYIDALTFDLREITAEGVVNEVKPKTS